MSLNFFCWPRFYLYWCAYVLWYKTLHVTISLLPQPPPSTAKIATTSLAMPLAPTSRTTLPQFPAHSQSHLNLSPPPSLFPPLPPPATWPKLMATNVAPVELPPSSHHAWPPWPPFVHRHTSLRLSVNYHAHDACVAASRAELRPRASPKPGIRLWHLSASPLRPPRCLRQAPDGEDGLRSETHVRCSTKWQKKSFFLCFSPFPTIIWKYSWNVFFVCRRCE